METLMYLVVLGIGLLFFRSRWQSNEGLRPFQFSEENEFLPNFSKNLEESRGVFLLIVAGTISNCLFLIFYILAEMDFPFFLSNQIVVPLVNGVAALLILGLSFQLNLGDYKRWAIIFSLGNLFCQIFFYFK